MSINEQRLELIKTIMEDDTIAAEEEEVLHILLANPISKDPIVDTKEKITVGQKAADGLAKFAGSWRFIIIFFFILVTWIAINAVGLSSPYDPYPFILLNLILSCLAAIQAPVIMMSQNRQEEKDRMRAWNDYKVNLKSEIIIEDIHSKLDLILDNQKIITDRLNELEKK